MAKTEKKPYDLVIVESPAKAKTIGKILGSKYKVIASQGHVRDLPKSRLGVDIENNFEPEYIKIRGKAPLLNEIKKEAKGARKVYLATDPDREGEAISWHIDHIIEVPDARRIEFHEITKNAIQESIKHPRDLDIERIDAQQARRVLDRLVGYKLSPILWEKVKKGLSAGRVQSVALRMICELEEEIRNFKPEEYWSLEAELNQQGSKKKFNAKYSGTKTENKIELKTEEQVSAIIKEIENAKFIVEEVKRGKMKKHAEPPFYTSTMQQAASRKIGFSTKKTMLIAQQLYEGVDVKKKGTIGLVSYIRTDSVRIAEEAQAEAKKFITENYGEEYAPEAFNVYKGRKGAQDAHEAIRPTDVNMTPDSVKDSLSNDQYKLYNLIYNRFLASQMSDAQFDTLNVTISADDHIFKVGGQTMTFAGFTAVYNDEKKEKKQNLPDFEKGQICELNELFPEQHFTQPPARFTEASLVKALEEKGIGRPSTYAPTISTIFDRGYVNRKEKAIVPTELGEIVNDLIVGNFPQVVDLEFTANMEDELDQVEEGKENWKKLIADFYVNFAKELEKAEASIEKIQIADEVSDVQCEKCGAMMVYKVGRYGKFLACPKYPECKNTKAITETLDVPCPECGGKVKKLRTKKGKFFYGCENYPKCEFVSWDIPTEGKCANCGHFLVEKESKGQKYKLCPECKTKVEE